MKFILLINAKISTIVGILTYISIINRQSDSFEARDTVNFYLFSFYGQLKFHAQLNLKKKFFVATRPGQSSDCF